MLNKILFDYCDVFDLIQADFYPGGETTEWAQDSDPVATHYARPRLDFTISKDKRGEFFKLWKGRETGSVVVQSGKDQLFMPDNGQFVGNLEISDKGLKASIEFDAPKIGPRSL